jgi:hypothetical protein
MYSIINNIYLSYDLVEHFVSPYLQKGAIKNIVKCLVMFEVQSQESMPKKLENKILGLETLSAFESLGKAFKSFKKKISHPNESLRKVFKTSRK